MILFYIIRTYLFLILTYDILFNIFRRDRVEGDGGNEGSVEDEEEEVEEAVRGGGRKDYRISLICVLCYDESNRI